MFGALAFELRSNKHALDGWRGCGHDRARGYQIMKLVSGVVALLSAACLRIEVDAPFVLEYRFKSRGEVSEEQIRELVLRRVEPLTIDRASVTVEGGNKVKLWIDPAPDAAGVAQLRQRIENPETFAIIGVLDRETPGVDYDVEVERHRTWRTAHPNESLGRFNELRGHSDGPAPGVRWYRYASEAGPNPHPAELPGVDANVVHVGRGWTFSLPDVEQFEASFSAHGEPALGFDVVAARAEAFRGFTEHYLDRQLAFVIDESVVLVATIQTPLSSGAVIEAGWTLAERDSVLSELQLDQLPVTFEFVAARELR